MAEFIKVWVANLERGVCAHQDSARSATNHHAVCAGLAAGKRSSSRLQVWSERARPANRTLSIKDQPEMRPRLVQNRFDGRRLNLLLLDKAPITQFPSVAGRWG